MLKFSETSNSLYDVNQKWLSYFESLFEVMDIGTPCNRTTSLKNNLLMYEASKVILNAIKCAILENRSTTTNMESTPRRVLGSPNTKSIAMSSQIDLGMGNAMYNPVFSECPLAIWHV